MSVLQPAEVLLAHVECHMWVVHWIESLPGNVQLQAVKVVIGDPISHMV